MKRISIARHGDSDTLNAYLRDVARMPVLTDQASSALGARGCRGDVDAQEQLVHGHLRLVVRIAHHYNGFGLPLADLVSEGNIGLLRAAELYDPKFGTKFTTYASVWIKQRIHRAITKQARSVRIPVWRSQRLRKLARLNDALSSELGRNATADELAERLGLTAEQMAELEGDRLEVLSLDTPIDPDEADGRTLGDTFHDESAVDPAAKLSRDEITEEIIACLHDLDDRELEILSYKHGLHPHGQLSFRELGRRLGLSHEWVRRIAELAIVKVRRSLENRGGIPLGERRRLRERVLARIQDLAARPMNATEQLA